MTPRKRATAAPAAAPAPAVAILGREPAAWVGIIEAALSLALMFGWLHFIGLNTPEDVAIFMAVVSSALGLYVGFATRHTSLSIIVGFAKAAIALASVYGLHLTADRAAAIIAFVSIVFAFFNRETNEPLADLLPPPTTRAPAAT